MSAIEKLGVTAEISNCYYLQQNRPDVNGRGAVFDHVVHGLQVVQLDCLGDPLHCLEKEDMSFKSIYKHSFTS